LLNDPQFARWWEVFADATADMLGVRGPSSSLSESMIGRRCRAELDPGEAGVALGVGQHPVDGNAVEEVFVPVAAGEGEPRRANGRGGGGETECVARQAPRSRLDERELLQESWRKRLAKRRDSPYGQAYRKNPQVVGIGKKT